MGGSQNLRESSRSGTRSREHWDLSGTTINNFRFFKSHSSLLFHYLSFVQVLWKLLNAKQSIQTEVVCHREKKENIKTQVWNIKKKIHRFTKKLKIGKFLFWIILQPGQILRNHESHFTQIKLILRLIYHFIFFISVRTASLLTSTFLCSFYRISISWLYVRYASGKITILKILAYWEIIKIIGRTFIQSRLKWLSFRFFFFFWCNKSCNEIRVAIFRFRFQIETYTIGMKFN